MKFEKKCGKNFELKNDSLEIQHIFTPKTIGQKWEQNFFHKSHDYDDFGSTLSTQFQIKKWAKKARIWGLLFKKSLKFKLILNDKMTKVT